MATTDHPYSYVYSVSCPRKHGVTAGQQQICHEVGGQQASISRVTLSTKGECLDYVDT